MVEKVGNSVTPQATLALSGIPNVYEYMPLLVRESSVSVRAFYSHCSLEVVECLQGVRFVVAVFL